MFNKYYQDELTYLRQLGREFADAYPQAGHMLSEVGTDPDVERLLEGFAFLTGRVRQRLDSELPELTHAFIGLLWPHYLRPVPSMTVVQFDPSATLQDVQTIPKGTEIDSKPVDGTRCRFRTTSEVLLYPFTLESTELDMPMSRPAQLKLQFRMSDKANSAEIDYGSLRLYLHGEAAIAYELYLLLTRHVRAVTFSCGDRKIRVDDGSVCEPFGFDNDDALLPYPAESFPGYRLLQEFFALPEKFLAVTVQDISALAKLQIEDNKGRFEISFEFDQRPSDRLRVKSGVVRTGCTPAVNLVSLRSAPIRVDHDKTEYRLRADAPTPQHYEIFSIDRVIGWVRGTVTEREYPPFFSYEHGTGGPSSTSEYYQLRLRPAAVGGGTETYLSFAAGVTDGIMPSTETVAADLTCTNREICEKLRPGDVNVATSRSPTFATFTNITRVTPSVPPPLEGRLLWQLISHLSLNYLTVTKVESLRALLALYNFHALVDRQAARTNELRLAGIKAVRAQPHDLIRQGAVYRGMRIDLELQEDAFAGEGEMLLFASVLNSFFGLYATMNCFTQLRVKGIQQGGTYEWPPMLGQQRLL